MDFEYVWTKDNLRLQGVHYEPSSKDICVLDVHGMSGNILENYFAHVLGKTLAKNDIGFLYGHNRGYNHINDIVTKEVGEDGGYKTVRMGATYERFEGCINDISAWMEVVRKLGYSRTIILGHSLGCNKTIHYFAQNKLQDIKGIILASPPDMVGLARQEKNYQEQLKEAKENIRNNQPRKILPSKLWDWYDISAQTYLDLFEDEGPADNLPVERNPQEFAELSTINVPILGIMGENDDIAIRTLQQDLDLISSKATSCPDFIKKFIPNANHVYSNQEEAFANVVLDWVKQI